jgi:hypothetical protein
MQCRDGAGGSVADAAKARYENVFMASQEPALLRRLLRAKDRMHAASEEDGQSRGSP